MAAIRFLKGNTSATIKLGPFLGSTDGNTPETALTISQADVRLSKNGGDFAQKTESTSCTHDELGYYDCPIDATDTNTYGALKIVVAESGALLVDQDYFVLPEPVYDSLFPAASGSPLPIFGILDWGVAQASSSGTLVHRPGLSMSDDVLNGAMEHVYSGTGAGQSRVVHDFTGSTDTASVSPNWATTPSTDSRYITFTGPLAPTAVAALPKVDITAIGGDEQSATDLKDFVDAGYDPATNKVQGVVTVDTATAVTTVNGIASNVITASSIATDAVTEIVSGVWAAGSRTLTALDEDATTLDIDATIRTALGMASASFDADIGATYAAAGAAETAANAAASNASTLLTRLTSARAGYLDNLSAGAVASQASVNTLSAGIITGAAATGTLSTTQATTNLTGYTTDQLKGRVIIWLTGNCEGEASDITANTGSGLLTFTAMTTAPADGDTFKIV